MTAWNTAIALARKGVHVFPLGRGDDPDGYKRPLPGTNGFKDATSDVGKVEFWSMAYPDHNYGIACGPSDLTVFDLDVGEGKNGERDLNLEAFQNTKGPFEFRKHFIVETPSGGKHIYLKGALEKPRGKLRGTAVDIRSGNGYVVGPSCRAPNGREYMQNQGAAIQPIPTWMRRIADRAHEDSSAPAPDAGEKKSITESELTAVLDTLDPGGYEDWFPTILAVHDAEVLGADGEPICDDAKIDILDRWSAQDPEKYSGRGEIAYKYHSGQGEGYTIASVIARAKDEGYRPKPRANVDGFKDIVADKPATKEGWAAHTFEDGQWDQVGETKWLAKGLIEAGGLHLVSGAYGTMKTFFNLTMTLDLCRGVATFQKVEDGQEGDDPQVTTLHKVTRPQRWAYVAGEGAFGFRERVEAYKKHRGLDLVPNFFFIREMPLIMDEDKWAGFLEHVVSLRLDGVVLDTYTRLMAGLDTNTTRDAGIAVARLQQLQKAGIAVLVVHHTGKDEDKGSKGAVDLPGAADLELLVASKAPAGEMRLKMRKVKNAKDWGEKHMAFNVVEVDLERQDEDGDDVKSLTVEFKDEVTPSGGGGGKLSPQIKELDSQERAKLDKSAAAGNIARAVWKDMNDHGDPTLRPNARYDMAELRRWLKGPETRPFIVAVMEDNPEWGAFFGNSPDDLAKSRTLRAEHPKICAALGSDWMRPVDSGYEFGPRSDPQLE